MQVLWETTEWADSTANNVYFMDDSKSKMYAYVARGSMDVFRFKNPIRVDMRGRSFVNIPNIWHYESPEEETVKTEWTFEGSTGAKYIVRKDGTSYNCTCPGYTYRGDCKHVKERANGS
jgi:hypothetical protein